MKILSSVLVMSILMANVGLANDLSVYDEEIFTAEDDTASEMMLEEEERVPVAAIIGIVIAAVGFGCNFAKDEGKALAKRDPSAKKTYRNNRWKIRAAVAAASPGGLVVLRCFEQGLMGN